MNIAILCHASMGGSGIVATELAMALAELGHSIHIVGEREPFRLSPGTFERNSSERPVQSPSNFYQDLGEDPPITSIWSLLTKVSKASISRWFNKRASSASSTKGRLRFHEIHSCESQLFEPASYVTLRTANSLAAVVEKYGIDIIHAHYAIPHATAAILARDSGLPVKVITTLHGTDVLTTGSEPAFIHTTRHALKNSDAVTAVSSFLADQAATRFGVNRADISVIPNWVDTTRFAPNTSSSDRLRFAQPEEALIVHASNFRSIKRSSDVIRVFSKVCQTAPARLLMVGDGPELQQCQELAQELNVIGRIQFIGPCLKIEQYFGLADIFLLTSITESFSLVSAEAMSCGMAVVSYNVGGVSELINSPTVGTLVQDGDTEAMATAVLDLIQHPEQRQEIGANARASIVSSLTPEAAVNVYLEHYSRLLSKDV